METVLRVWAGADLGGWGGGAGWTFFSSGIRPPADPKCTLGRYWHFLRSSVLANRP